jgi:hypothetical protein
MRCHRVRLLTGDIDPPFNSMEFEYHSGLGRARHGSGRSTPRSARSLAHGYVTMLPSFVLPEIVPGVAMFMVVSLVLKFIPLGTWADRGL